MLRSLFNLFSFAWAKLVSVLGTTTFSLILYSFVIPILIFVAKLVINWRQGRKHGVTMKQVIRRSLLSWQTVVPSAIYLLVLCGLVVGSIINTTYNDHKSLLKRIAELRKDRDSYKGILIERDKKITELEGKINELKGKSKKFTFK